MRHRDKDMSLQNRRERSAVQLGRKIRKEEQITARFRDAEMGRENWKKEKIEKF